MTEYGLIRIEYDYPEAPKPKEKMDKKTIVEFFLVTGILGFAVYGFDKFSDLYVWLIKKTPLIDYYATSEAMFNIVQALFSIFAIMLPFLIAYILIKLVQRKNARPWPFWAPSSTKFFFAALAFAFLTVVVCNALVGLATIGFEAVGFEFDESDMPDPKSVGGYFWQVLSVALVPAFVEEFAIRGVMLQSLRRYGDAFAIIVSSIFFGLMHGNLLQAPFAFFLGIVISWLVIVTDSLWTGIAIHFMNNLYAVSLTGLAVITSDTVYVIIAAAVNIIGGLLGLLSIIWIVDKQRGKLHLKNMYRWQPYVFAVLSIPLTAAFIYFVYLCSQTVHYVGVS